ncbi:MAG TPA: GNAT family N-acetyltransferase [Acidimicrobiales bacterium]
MNELGPSDLHAVAAFCERSVRDAPTARELHGALFAPDQPAVVLGDPSVGIVALAECSDGPHIRLLAVDPEHRGKGQGRALVRAAEAWVRSAGQHSLITGADPPYFLWPGVPSSETQLLCLFERLHYNRAETNFNMDVDLGRIPDDPGGHQLAGSGDRDEVDTWMETHWSNWRPEALRALDKGNLVISRESGDGAINAFCAFEVNREGLLGPVAVRPELMGQGKGKAALLGALHELRRRGRTSVSVVWIGPVVPYAAVGGRVTDVYFVYRKDLP